MVRDNILFNIQDAAALAQEIVLTRPYLKVRYEDDSILFNILKEIKFKF